MLIQIPKEGGGEIWEEAEKNEERSGVRKGGKG